MFIVQSHKEGKELLAELTIDKATRISLQHALGDKKAFFSADSQKLQNHLFSLRGKLFLALLFPYPLVLHRRDGRFRESWEIKRWKKNFLEILSVTVFNHKTTAAVKNTDNRTMGLGEGDQMFPKC